MSSNRKIAIFIIVLVLLVVLLLFWGYQERDKGDKVNPTATPSETPTRAALTKEILIKDFKFSPSAIAVSQGTRIRFTNNDQVAHTAVADNDSFDTGDINPGQGAVIDTANIEPGTYTFKCLIHPTRNMTGTIVITKGEIRI